MKNLKNKVTLIGNLGIDPEVKTFDNGKMLARFPLATSESYKNDSGERITNTQWHTLIAWGKTAEIAGKYLRKGEQIVVDGKLVSRSYEDKKGEKRYITEVHINEFMMLGRTSRQTGAKA